MSRKSIREILQGALGFAVVVAVIICAFVFRDQIEKYAMTGYIGVLVACFASTATILLPAPGILVVVQYARILNPALVVLLGALGTALGEMTGYFLGYSGSKIVSLDTESRLLLLLKKRPMLSVLLFSVIPLPIFDVVGVCAGITRVHPLKFLVACFFGKLLKIAAYTVLVGYAESIITAIL